MSTLNNVAIKAQYQAAIEQRRKALNDLLDVRERLEATVIGQIDSRHPDLMVATSIHTRFSICGCVAFNDQGRHR